MPGCGKSTIGRQLARSRQLPFLDSDHEIERFLGCSIREFFDREGEAAFRDIEQRVLAETLASDQSRLVATGGGSVLRPANREAMKARSTVVYLHTLPEDLARRLSRDTQRPLLQVADIVVDTAHKSAATLVNLISMQLDLSAGAPQDAE